MKIIIAVNLTLIGVNAMIASDKIKLQDVFMTGMKTLESTLTVNSATGNANILACSDDMRNIMEQAQKYFANGHSENTRIAYVPPTGLSSSRGATSRA